MRKVSAVVLTVLLAACTVAPSTPTATSGLQSNSITQPPLASPIPTITGVLPTNTQAVTEVPPTALPRLETGSPLVLASLDMINQDIGWGIESGGHIVRTLDGGNSWQDVNPPQGLYDENVFFALDAKMAWSTHRPSDECDASRMSWGDYQECMPGPKVVFWRTTDGGITWQQGRPYEVEEGHYKPVAVQFIDASIGRFLYVSNFGPMGSAKMRMAKTVDGGLSWGSAAAPQSICVHRAMVFINGEEGWSGADCRFTPTVGTPLQDFINGKSAPDLYRTTNGSQSWEGTTLPSPEVFPPEFTSPSADPNVSILCGTTSMQWISSEAFTLHWTCSSEVGTPYFEDISYGYSTSDSGQTWQSWLATGNDFFLNAQTGWRLYSPGEGQLSQLQHTTDGGQTWKTFKSVTWQTAQFDFVSEQIGWAIVTSGDATAFLHTTDGGQNWSELKPKTVIAIGRQI